jgi:uncharacterized protein YicC (UPF0701 family)
VEDKPESSKYVRVNPRLSAIEIDLPPHLEKYGEELREKIRQEFSFRMMDSALEARIQEYVEDFLREKGEI